MRSLVFVSPERLEWREMPDARVMGDGEALVRPVVIGRCDLDLGYVRGLVPMESGTPIGHEIIGDVVDVGDRVTRFRPGDRVVVPAQISCGDCRNCRRGFTGRCQSVPFAASYGMGRAGGYGGGASDLVRVPFADAMLVALPRDADPIDWIGFTDMALHHATPRIFYGCELSPGARAALVGLGRPELDAPTSADISAAWRRRWVSKRVRREETLQALASLGPTSVRASLHADADGQFHLPFDAI